MRVIIDVLKVVGIKALLTKKIVLDDEDMVVE